MLGSLELRKDRCLQLVNQAHKVNSLRSVEDVFGVWRNGTKNSTILFLVSLNNRFGDGIEESSVGYAGGHVKNPSYKQVCSGNTQHAEVVQVKYNPEKVKYDDLVTFFFKIHDPTTIDRQGNDVGTQYRSVIFYHDSEQEEIANKIMKQLNEERFNNKICTQIVPMGEYWLAEDYHQQYLDKNPGGYCNHKIRW